MRLGPLRIAALALLLPLVGCGSNTDDGSGRRETPPSPSAKRPATVKEVPRPGDQRVTMTWKGQERVYTVHAPPGYTPGKPLPLVVVMHPYPADGAYAARLTGFDAKADAEGFLVAYPNGVNQGYNALVCCGSEDDVGFIGAMTKRLVGTWKADPRRVYATGISNGADMSFRLAVELPGTLAAIAPVSGGYIGTAAQNPAYVPKTPVSVATFVGGRDAYYEQFEQGIKSWSARLGCRSGRPQAVKGANTRTRATCRDTSEVLTYRLPDMGHNWPGSKDPRMGEEATGVTATDLIWEFFAAHARKSS
ncbi:polyhydroxybutyrate depolymerase [Streptomyces sp. NBC_00250]|uniref:alpha/beta hydrolase family esterase n=1 Tax=Streptomyces sp. NBC_00250 TaxID=2903641 RepID=UPI002E2B76DA|nr:PHB depolymerase family esterase [Streptomyces sp. NBC_00250]